MTVLQKHAQDFAARHEDPHNGHITVHLAETFQQRYDATGGGTRTPIYNDAYAAAYLLDTYYDVHDAKGTWYPSAIMAA